MDFRVLISAILLVIFIIALIYFIGCAQNFKTPV